MLRSKLLGYVLVAAAAIAFLSVTPSFAQDDDPAAGADGVVVQGSPIERQDFEATSPATSVGSEQLGLSETLTVDRPLAARAWTSNNDRTSSRTGGRASSVRVIRACEISLALGDEDCADK
jgi:hypothetical protein